MEKHLEADAQTTTLTANSLGFSPWSLGGQINAISCSPIDDTVAVAGQEKSVVFAGDGSIKFALGQGGICLDVNHSPDGKLIAAGFHGNGGLVVYSAADGQELRHFKGHAAMRNRIPTGVRRVKFSPDGTLLASVSTDRSLRIWRVSDGKQLERYEFDDVAIAVDWFPDQTRLIVGTDNGLERVIRATPDKKRAVFKIDGLGDAQCVEIDGQLRIAASGYTAIYFFNEDLKRSGTFSQSDVCRIRFSADRKMLCAASWDSRDQGVSIWDMASKNSKKLEESAGISMFGLDINMQTGEVFMGGKNNAIQRCCAAGELDTNSLADHRDKVPAIEPQPINVESGVHQRAHNMNTQADKAALPPLSPVAYVLMPGSEVVSRLKQDTTKPFQAALDDWSVFDETQWHVFDGDLHVTDYAFFANKAFVCILGNLTVDGNVLTGESNCKAYDSKEKPERFDDSFFIVKGDVRCKNLFNGELNTALINGNLIVDEVIYTSTMDSVLYTYGDIKARYLHSDGGWLSICNDGIHFDVEAWDDYIEFHGANAASIIRTGKCEQRPLTKYLQTQSDKKVRKLLSLGASILK